MAYRPFDRVFTPADLAASLLDMEDLLDHLNRPPQRDNDLIESYAVAAQNIVERETGRLLSSRACTLKLNGLPASDPIELPGGIVNTLTSVVVDGTTITGCAVHGDSPARLYPSDTWPAVVGTVYPVVISYVAGYTTIPGALATAIKIIVADLYDRRESVTPDQAHASPFAAKELMRFYRIKPL